MALPRFHSFTWSDDEERGRAPLDNRDPTRENPQELVDKEVHFWVTYPDERVGRKKGKKAKHRRNPKSLWAVLIVERVRRAEAFAYEVSLKRIFKTGERMIRVWVKNDPADQSDDAIVIQYLAPNSKDLSPLEQRMCELATKRVYDSITATWPRDDLPAEEAIVSSPGAGELSVVS